MRKSRVSQFARLHSVLFGLLQWIREAWLGKQVECCDSGQRPLPVQQQFLWRRPCTWPRQRVHVCRTCSARTTPPSCMRKSRIFQFARLHSRHSRLLLWMREAWLGKQVECWDSAERQLPVQRCQLWRRPYTWPSQRVHVCHRFLFGTLRR